MATKQPATPQQTSGPVRRRRVVTPEPKKESKSLAQMRAEQMAADKQRFLAHLDTHLGVITYACEASGIPRRTIYDWLDVDPEFLRQVKDVDHKQMDFAERKLLERINGNDTRAIIFYCSTKGRSRGYTTKVEITTPLGEPIETTNVHAHVDVTEARSEVSNKALRRALTAAFKQNPAAFPIGDMHAAAGLGK